MISCINEIQNVVGETVPEIDLKIAATKYNYNYDLALNSVLSGEQIIMDKPKKQKNKNTNDKKQNKIQQDKKKGKKSELRLILFLLIIMLSFDI